MEITRDMVLAAMVLHETLTLSGLEAAETMGLGNNKEHLHQLLLGLVESHHLTLLNGVTPETYTITEKGIEEGKHLADAQHLKVAHSFGYGAG